jgi:hypothetical protein
MANDTNLRLKTEVESKIADVDGKLTEVQRLPDGTARAVIEKPAEEIAEED